MDGVSQEEPCQIELACWYLLCSNAPILATDVDIFPTKKFETEAVGIPYVKHIELARFFDLSDTSCVSKGKINE